jgi:RNA-directed DNA polymerase
MTHSIDPHVSAALPVVATEPPTRRKKSDADRAEYEKTRTLAQARWLEIEAAGGRDEWVRVRLIELGHQPDLGASDDLTAKEREAFKNSKVAERAERSKLLVLAEEARRFGTIGFLGNGVHWSEHTDSDAFDVRDRELVAQRNGLPAIGTAAELAAAMKVSISTLRWFAAHRDVDAKSHYISWQIPKRSGGSRTITAPLPQLKALQRWALRNYFEKLPVHAAAHGFLPARSVVTNAMAHAGADVIVKLDIENFFPTVTWKRVKGLLRKAGTPESVATLLALLATEAPRQWVDFRGGTYSVATGERVLPQGAPTSPAIANAVCMKLDARLAAFARQLGLTYTRYADDLTFSFKKSPEQKRLALGLLVEKTKDILRSEGFNLNASKTRVLRRGMAQRITGLTINAADAGVPQARVPRAVLRQLRAAIHGRKQGKPYREGESRAYLQGMAAWVYMSDAKRGAHLLSEVARLPE